MHVLEVTWNNYWEEAKMLGRIFLITCQRDITRDLMSEKIEEVVETK